MKDIQTPSELRGWICGRLRFDGLQFVNNRFFVIRLSAGFQKILVISEHGGHIRIHAGPDDEVNDHTSLVGRLGLGVPPVDSYRTARLFRLAATSGWSGPSFASSDLEAAPVERLGLGVPARRLVQGRQVVQARATSGWSGPSFASSISRLRGRAARPRRTGPSACTGPPGCSGRGHVGVVGPELRLMISRLRGRAARPRRTGPSPRTAPPGC